jgi:hypothetical protein
MMITGLQWFVCSVVDLFPDLFDPGVFLQKKKAASAALLWKAKSISILI